MNRRRSKLVGLALVAALVAVLAPSWSWSSSAPLDDDDDEREYRRAMASRSFVENCLMCHGEDMTSRQRLTTKQWTAEVEKMVGWGAPLPPEARQPLVDYLAETYPNTRTAPSPERISPDQITKQEHQPAPVSLGASDPTRGEALFAAHCAVCHGPQAKGGDLGVNLVEKPPLLREAEFRTLLKEGRRRMPGFAAVLDEPKQADLLAWLRLRK